MKKIALLLTLALLASCAVQPVPPAAVTLETIPTLDAAQIRALSEAQIDALGVENTIGLEAATAQLRAQTVIRFPNYNDTLFVAISITYERYLSDYYRQTSGPDWSDNGCSGPTPPVIFDATACRQHDFGYRNVSKYAADAMKRCARQWTAASYPTCTWVATAAGAGGIKRRCGLPAKPMH